jgi:2-polyprenyl-3-methyl-5-hydroxy-6-metoxy-1,4-benzoquinol methylase
MKNQNDINAQFYDEIYAFVKGESVTNAECLLMSALINDTKGKILDIGAGTGRHAIEMVKKGYEVTAIDSSEGMLKKIDDAKLRINTINSDIFSFIKGNDEKFDLIILMWNAFNEIALTKESAIKLIKGLKTKLKTNGQILINIDKAPLKRPYKPKFVAETILSNGSKVIINWSNEKHFSKTNTTISKEQLILNGNALKPALIKQRWWRLSEINRLIKPLNLKMKKYMLKCNTELYLTIS